jgi:hypothetical protein
MRTTPSIPSWIRDFRHDGYTNVFEFLPDNPRLYGTETLFGDWGAQTLLLAKDAAPAQIIKSSGWRHAERTLGDSGGWRTNERLKELADLIPGSKLYGSAAANMLYDNPRWSRSLKGFRYGPLHDYLVKVLRWVVFSMPNVRVIACLGDESWYLTSMAMGESGAAKRWSDFRNNAQALAGTIEGKTVIATPHYHPAARISSTRVQANWHSLDEVLRAPA